MSGSHPAQGDHAALLKKIAKKNKIYILQGEVSIERNLNLNLKLKVIFTQSHQ